jgi:hypothetical protein
MMARGSVLLFALLLNARTIWEALADQSISLETATIHFLVTVAIVGFLFTLLRMAASRPRSPSRSRGSRPSQPTDRP